MIQNSQYYTETVYSKLLVDKIEAINPQLIIDLGVGKGALIQAALDRWAGASFVAIDIDKNNCNEIKKKKPCIRTLHVDGLTPRLNENIKIAVGSVDVAICNPPYKRFTNDIKYNVLFDSSGLPNCKKMKSISTDIIFLANNISLLKRNGYLGIIMPDGIITRKDLISVRENIVNNHTIHHIIQLPEKIFAKTEARTYIIILTKGKLKQTSTKLSLADKNGNCIDTIDVEDNLLINRMDYTFHKWFVSINKTITTNYSRVGIEICRGSLSHHEIKKKNVEFIHSTNFSNKFGFFKNNVYDFKCITAQKGDILIVRVGKRCIGRILRVKSGNVIFSDCVYRVRVPEKYQEYLHAYLQSDEFKLWVSIFSHGVCSLVISKCDLLEHLQEVLSKYTLNS